MNIKSQTTDNPTNISMLGQIVWLMANSPLHKDWPIASIFQWILPALINKQCRLYQREGRPIAYVSWAKMTKATEAAYVLNPKSLDPQDWAGGDRNWIIDWIAPYGDTPLVMKDLREGLFKDEVGRALRVKPGSDEMNIIYIHGANALAKSQDLNLNPSVDLREAESLIESKNR